MTTQDIDIPEWWIETTLSEVIKTNISSIDKNFTFDDLLYLDTGSITENRIEQIQNVKISDAPSRARRLVKDGDIVYSTVRPNQKHFGFITNPPENLVVSTGFTVISSIPEKSDSKFLYYFLTQEQITNELQQIAEHSTSTYPSIRPENIENLSILLPQLPEQKEIAAILSSFDDKIELLRKQNETLEKTAQTIFQEWFGKYSIDDELPEGWRVGKLGEEFDILMGQSPDWKSYNEIGNGIVFFQWRTDFTDRFPSVRLYTTEPKRMAEKFDVLVSVRAPVGDINVANQECCIWRWLAAVKSPYKSYSLYKLKANKEAFDKFETEWTVFGSINKDAFNGIKVAIPPTKIISEFEDIAKPIDAKIFNNFNEINSLSKARDELLPKLMSWVIRV